MSVFVATGMPQLDQALKQGMQWEERIEHLEQLEFAVASRRDIQTVVLSEFIPSILDEDDQYRKYQSLIVVMQMLCDNRIRVIFLTTDNAPKWLIAKCISMGIYDLVICKGGNLRIQDIFNAFYVPGTKEDALKLTEINTAVQEEAAPIIFPVDETRYERVEQASVEESTGESMTEGSTQDKESEVEQDEQTEQVEQEYKSGEYYTKRYDKEGNDQIEDTGESEQLTQDGETEITPIVQRKMSSQKIQVNVKTVAFWGIEPGMGKRSVAQMFAKQCAVRGGNVLYCELDYFNPSFALTTGLSHPEKNFYKFMIDSADKNDFEIEPFIAKPSDLMVNRKLRKSLTSFPNTLHFLTLPIDFKPSQFPLVENENFTSTFMKHLNVLPYDLIVLNLPTKLENIFGFPVLLESNLIYNVLTLNPSRMYKYMQTKELLMNTPLNFNFWRTVVNQVPNDIRKETIDKKLIKETSFLCIPYDEERALLDLDLIIDSEVMGRAIASLVDELGFESLGPEKKKKNIVNFSL